MPASSSSLARSSVHAVRARRGVRRWGWGLAGGVLLLLLVVSVAGGLIATALLNRKLATLEDYVARVGAVRLVLWRAGVEVRDFELRERDKPDAPPLVRAGHASFAVDVWTLLRGRLAGTGLVEDVEIYFVQDHVFVGPGEAAKKAAAEVEEGQLEAGRWQTSLARALPFELRRFEMKRAQVHYIDRARQPDVVGSIRDLQAVVTGLGNRPSPDAELPARAEVRGVTTGGGRLQLTLDADPTARLPRFRLAFELKELAVPELNDFMRAYAGADVSRGTFELYSEITAGDGAYQGYVKPFFRDLDFKNVGDENKNLAARAKEKVVSAISALLENRDKQQVATITPFSGTLAAADVDVWATVHQLLRNAFVEALREGLGGQG